MCKRINKIIKELMSYYMRYRIIQTNDIFEVKLTPHQNDSREKVFLEENTKNGRMGILMSLEKELRECKNK